MAKIKPVYVMNENGLGRLEKAAVLDGIHELLGFGGVSNLIEIVDYMVWRNDNYVNPDGSLKEYQSVDWFLQQGKNSSRSKSQVNATTMLHLLTFEPFRKIKDHYDCFIVHSDMYDGRKDINFVIGLAREGIGTIISTDKFSNLDDRMRYECVKTETMHEMGHVFGLLPNSRNYNVENSLGKHCANRCIMRQGLTLPSDWIKMTDDRWKYGPLCKDCKQDIKDYFRR